MWLHCFLFIVFIVLTICGGGDREKRNLDFDAINPSTLNSDNNTKEEIEILQTEPFKNVSSNLPCLDKLLSFEERVEEAALIFTGRVKWIGGTVRLHDAEGEISESGPGGRIGGVSVLSFIKGGHNSSNKELIVEGFESPLLCSSRAKVKEQRIFLVSQIDGKHVGLISSLLPINRRNLQQINLILEPEQKGTKKIRHLPTMDRSRLTMMDPIRLKIDRSRQAMDRNRLNNGSKKTEHMVREHRVRNIETS